MASAVPQFRSWLAEERVERLSRSLGESDRVHQLRTAAERSFQELPVEPNPLYRGYSNLGGTDLAGLDLAATGPPVPLPPAEPNTLRVVHDASGSRVELPELLQRAGVRVRTLPELWQPGGGDRSAWPDDPPADKVHALALATLNRAVEIEIPDRCALPVRVQDLTVLSRPHESRSVYRRISVGRGARVLCSEELYTTPDGGPTTDQRLYASVVDAAVAEDAVLQYLSVHAPDGRVVSAYQRHGTLGSQSRLAWIWSGFGGFRTRLRNRTDLPGSGSRVEDLQTFYGRGEEAYDSAVEIRHIGTDTHGQSVTRGLFTDRSRGVSRGLVRIESEARKTLSFLSEHAMLLSRGASSETIPVLEILCRDVKATHSSSVAPVDPEKVFYLASRGIPEDDGVRMIGEGFLSHVLERAPVDGLRDHLYPLLAARWEDRPIGWAGPGFPALAPLTVGGDLAPDEWRFDAKLR